MKLLPLLAILILCPVASAQDQRNPTTTPDSNSTSSKNQDFDDSTGAKGFWEATLPGGSYLVALSRITAISKHEYLLDGNLVVTEVTIDTLGDTTMRVYQITPAAQYGTLATTRRVVERGRDLLDRTGKATGVDLTNMVQKHLPTTTHAKTVEFRVKSLATLDALHKSARNAWVDNKGRKFVAKQ